MVEDCPNFWKLSDDVVLKILFQLEDDPRNWARLSCVCTKFTSLISTVCCKSKCLSSFPSVSADLLSLSSSGGGGWEVLYKLAVCCPGLIHAGVLLDNSDFGLHRELGPDTDYNPTRPHTIPIPIPPSVASSSSNQIQITDRDNNHEFGGWSLYDDLYYDTVYNNSEMITTIDDDSSTYSVNITVPSTTTVDGTDHILDSKFMVTDKGKNNSNKIKKRKVMMRRPNRAHLASGSWNLSREQGNKLLGSRFRDDCLYICDWPGCVHMEEKRNYMLFRGFFKNFKRSRVWRTINDGNSRSKIELNCAFCKCKETWDLHSAFCLKRGFGFHDDGDPVVRAYVCENGHVSGAWTDQPLYT